MKRLHDFYKSSLKFLVLIIASLAVFLAKDGLQLIEQNFRESRIIIWLFKLLLSSTFFSLLFALGEWLIRKYIWKARFFNQDIDFSGKWLGWSFYTHQEIAPAAPGEKQFIPFYSAHEVVVEQDCLYIAIIASIGKDFGRWASVTATISENKDLGFAYKVYYEGPRKQELGSASMGYEEMSIVLKHPDNDRLPILLSGNFYHCATGDRPKYRGSTVFIREKYLHLIKPENLPGYVSQFKVNIFK